MSEARAAKRFAVFGGTGRVSTVDASGILGACAWLGRRVFWTTGVSWDAVVNGFAGTELDGLGLRVAWAEEAAAA